MVLVGVKPAARGPCPIARHRASIRTREEKIECERLSSQE